MKYTLAIAALLASTSAVKITELNKHACDFIEDNGEETSTSLMPEYVQVDSEVTVLYHLSPNNGQVDATMEIALDEAPPIAKRDTNTSIVPGWTDMDTQAGHQFDLALNPPAAAVQVSDEVEDKEAKAAQAKASEVDTAELAKKEEIFSYKKHMKDVWNKSLEGQAEAF